MAGVTRGLPYYRERILDSILLAAATIGFLAYVPSVYLAQQTGQAFVVVVDTVVYLAVVALAIWRRRVPFALAAWAVPLLSFGLGVMLSVRFGPVVGGGTWLLAFPVLIAVLLGSRPALWALVASVVAVAGIGVALAAGWLNWPDQAPDAMTGWLVSSINLTFLATIITLSVGFLLSSLKAETEVRHGVEEERARMALAVQQAPNPVAIAGSDGALVYVNHAFTVLTGWTEGEVLGRSPQALGVFGGDSAVHEAVAAALGRAEAWHGEVLGMRRDGSRFEGAVTLAPLRDDAGTVTHQVLTLRDKTRESDLGRQLQQTQKLEAIGTLAGGIAHDFNNLLLPILTNAELLFGELPPGTAARAQAGDVVISARRARELVQRILTFSRRREPERRPMLLEDVVREVGQLLRSSLPATIDFRVLEAPGPLPVHADEAELHQVVMNLATNAWHAMRDAPSGVLTISLGLVGADTDRDLMVRGEEGMWVRISVEDTGVGMAPEVLERAFDPFYTTKPVGEGTGLGLATVHGIVTSLGGHLAATSTPGQGTTICVYLRPSEAGVGVAASPGMASGVRARTVLVVDDELLVLRATERMISRLGHQVITRPDPEGALDLILELPDVCDLLFTDLTMPGLSGLELVRRVREVRPDLPVILATGYLDATVRESVAAAGIEHVIGKPFSAEEIAEVLRAALRDGE